MTSEIRAANDKLLWRSLAWIGGARWSIQFFTWASSLVVARLLSPSDFGIVGLASLYVGVITLVADSGLGSAVVTLRTLSRAQIAQLNVLSGLVGLALFLLSWALAWPIGWFFETPALPPVIILMTVSIAIAGWQSIPDALLQNETRFRALALRDTIRGLVTALGTAALAWLGYGYWALAWGVVIGSICSLALTLFFRRAALALPSLAGLKEPLSYAVYSLGSRLAWYGYSNADFFVAGKTLTTAGVGAYTFAWSIANVPVEKVSTLVGRVTPTFFSSVQNDPVRLARYLETLTRVIALVSFPISVGIALVASDFIPLALGSQWVTAVAPLVPLSLYAGFRSLTPLLSTILRVTGDQKFGVQNAMAGLLLMPIAFYIGSHWGPMGIAYAWVVAYPLLIVPQYRRVFWRLSITASTYLQWLAPALLSTLAMVVVVCAIQWLAPLTPRTWTRLVLCVVAGALTYAGVLLGAFRSTLPFFKPLAADAAESNLSTSS